MESEGQRFKQARLKQGLTLQDLVLMTGYSMSTISGVENGHDAPSKRLRGLLIQRLDVNEEWLKTGRGEMFSKAFWDDMAKNTAPLSDVYSPEESAIMGDAEFVNVINKLRLMSPAECERHMKAMRRLLDDLRGADDLAKAKERLREKNSLQVDSLKGKTSGDMKSEVQKLIEQVKRKVSKPGAKADLARKLDVAPARITEWLSGKKVPGGDYALRLQKWVEEAA